MQEEHRHTVESLQQHIDNVEIELDRHRSRLSLANSPPLVTSALVDNDITSDRVVEFIRELRVEERQSGEVT